MLKPIIPRIHYLVYGQIILQVKDWPNSQAYGKVGSPVRNRTCELVCLAAREQLRENIEEAVASL